jgi:hypothetical protein
MRKSEMSAVIKAVLPQLLSTQMRFQNCCKPVILSMGLGNLFPLLIFAD